MTQTDLSLSEDVRFRVVPDGCVVVNQQDSTIAVVNRVGGQVLAWIRDGHMAREELVRSLATTWGIEPSRADRDLGAYLDELVELGWLVGES
ncbi:MAG: PqqD family protein [Acidobacteriota bacterium]